MYPPPGSYRYPLPKPVRKNISSLHDECECNEIVNQCWSWWLTLPICKGRFWKILILITIVITSGHFSAIIMFPHVNESLFLICSKSIRKVPIPPPLDSPSHHRKMNNLIVPKITYQPRKSLGNIVDSRLGMLRNSSFNPEPSGFTPSDILPTPPIVGSREKPVITGRTEISTILKLCPPVPPNLEGPFKVILDNVPSLEVQERTPTELYPGGRFRPMECLSRHKVAIIIPFRDRASHLALFLYNIHPMLKKQQLDYAIFIIEQAGSGKFNRAMLMNVGSLEALKLYPYDCFVFHDVDLIPEDDRNLYSCPQQPRHMSVAINTFQYRLPYNDIFGGVSAMTKGQFKTVNGFSNRFWGWGGEDDDMSNRIKYYDFHISRYPANIGRYVMIPHKKDRPNPLRYSVLSEGKKLYQKDGLTSAKYKVLDIQLRTLYTWINVELFKV